MVDTNPRLADKSEWELKMKELVRARGKPNLGRPRGGAQREGGMRGELKCRK